MARRLTPTRGLAHTPLYRVCAIVALLAIPIEARPADSSPPTSPPVGEAQGALSALMRVFGGDRDSKAHDDAGGVQTRTISVGGLERRYYFYVPDGVGQSVPAPMVIALHGGAGDALQFAKRIGLRQMADDHGFVVVAPQGIGLFNGNLGGWNAESIQPLGFAETFGVDDVGFVAAVIGHMQSEVRIDPKRIYAMGLSKGGMMAYLLACAMPDKLSAIAVVAGTLSARDCGTDGGVGLLHIHGTADENVPWQGGHGSMSSAGADWPDVARGIEIFRKRDRCGANGPPRAAASDTQCVTSACAGGETVEVCRVDGGGHGWPGAEPAGWQIRNDVYVSPHFDATEYIAEFFAGD